MAVKPVWSEHAGKLVYPRPDASLRERYSVQSAETTTASVPPRIEARVGKEAPDGGFESVVAISVTPAEHGFPEESLSPKSARNVTVSEAPGLIETGSGLSWLEWSYNGFDARAVGSDDLSDDVMIDVARSVDLPASGTLDAVSIRPPRPFVLLGAHVQPATLSETAIMILKSNDSEFTTVTVLTSFEGGHELAPAAVFAGHRAQLVKVRGGSGVAGKSDHEPLTPRDLDSPSSTVALSWLEHPDVIGAVVGVATTETVLSIAGGLEMVSKADWDQVGRRLW